MKLVVTVPAFNEEKTLGKVLDGISSAVRKFKLSSEIVVVDDGSTDGTATIARKHGASVISHHRNLGLAESFRTEMKEALDRGADLILHTDADGQYDSADLPNLLNPLLEEKADLVLGSRFLGKIEHMPFLNRWGNKAFSRVISTIIHQKVTDAQTGFRAFTREIASLPLTSTHTYTQEQVIRTAREHFRILEVPVRFARRHDKSRLISNPFEYAIKAWVNILRINRDYAPLRFFGLIGGLFMLIGFALGIWIIVTFLQTGGVGGIPRVILSVLFLLTGVQILLFGFLADMLRK